MPSFAYTARTATGERVSGSMVAATERDVLSSLAARTLFPITVAIEKSVSQPVFGGRISQQRIATFYSQLASLIKNGVPLIKSLQILREQSAQAALQNALDDIIRRIEDGEQVSDAFARHPRLFSEMAVNMSRAGAEGGFLEDALERVASFTEHQAELKARTIGSLIYPVILATFGMTIMLLLLVFVVPRFEPMFNDMRERGNMPTLTEWLLAFSGWLSRWGWILGIVLVILFFLIRVQLRAESGRLLADRWRLRMPLFGLIFRNLAVARFCRVLGTLLKNGVPILKSLEISRQATGNRVLSQAIADATENISSGATLAEPLTACGHFPRNVTEMIAVAEESNSLDTVLVNISDGLERETTRRLELMVRMVEPLMLLVMAIGVLVIVLSLLMPIMQMNQSMRGG
jgi:type II secretory pathway component PulF